MVFSEKIGDGELRNKICPFCESGKKYKKCKCIVARKALISSIIPKESDLMKKKEEDASDDRTDNS